MTKATAIFIAILLAPAAFAQNPRKGSQVDANKIMNIQFHYTYDWTGGDMARSFGDIHNFGFGALFKTKKNWLYGIDASYQFGNEVNEDLLYSLTYNLTNGSGLISNTGGYDASYSISERGVNGFFTIGKVFPLGANRNSGVVVMAGGGILSHKINIAHARNDIPTLTEDLKKGYDRLSWGPAWKAFAGYYFQGKNRRVNFYLGFDFTEAFTENKRGYNYDQMAYDNLPKTDILYGFRLGWMIPIYLTAKGEQEFFYK